MLGMNVSGVGERISLGIYVSWVGEHIQCITRDIRFGVGEHIPLGICVSLDRGTHITTDICFQGRGKHH